MSARVSGKLHEATRVELRIDGHPLVSALPWDALDPAPPHYTKRFRAAANRARRARRRQRRIKR